MGSVDMEEKAMAAMAGEGEGVTVKMEENGDVSEGAGEEAMAVKCVPNDELNSKMSQDVLVEGSDKEVPVSEVAVNGSVVDAAAEEASLSGSAELDAGADPEVVPVVDATEKVESWDLSEALAKEGQEGGDKEELNPKIAEGGEGEGEGEEIDAQGAGEASVEAVTSDDAPTSDEPVEEAPVASVDVEETPENSDDAGDVAAVLPSESVENEEIDRGISAVEASEEVESEAVDSEAVDAPVEEVHEVMEAATSAEPDEELASPEAVPSPSDDAENEPIEVNSDDVEKEPIEVNSDVVEEEPVEVNSDDVEDASVDVKSEDLSEVAVVLPSESADDEDVSPELSSDRSHERGGSEVFYAPVEEVHEVVESTTSGDPDEESAEPESVSAPSNDVEDKSIDEESAEPESVPAPSDDVEDEPAEANSEDVNEATTALESGDKEELSPELPIEGSPGKVDALVEELVEVEEALSNAESDEESAEPEAVIAPADETDDISVEVNSEDVATSTESIDNKEESSSEIPSDNADSEALGVPVEEVHELAEAATNTEPEEGSVSPESVSALSADVEDKSVEVTEDTSEVTPELPSESADNEDVSPEPLVEGSPEEDNKEALYAPVEEVHEVVEATISGEPEEESAEPESVSAPADEVEGKSVELSSADVNEFSTVPDSADNEEVSPELSSEKSPEEVDSKTLHSPVEEIGEVEDASTDSKPDEEAASLESVIAASDEAQSTPEEVKPEVSAEEMEEATSTSLPAEEEIFDRNEYLLSMQEKTEVSDEGSAEDVIAASDEAQSTPEEVKSEVSAEEMEEATSTPLPAEEEIFDLNEYLLSMQEKTEVSDEGSAEDVIASPVLDKVTNDKEIDLTGNIPEEQSASSLESHEEPGPAEEGIAQTDRSLKVEEVPQESELESQSRSISMDDDVDGELGVAEGGDAIEEERPDTQSISADEPVSATVSIGEEIPLEQFITSVLIEHAAEDASDAVAEPHDEDLLTEHVEHTTADDSSTPSVIETEAKDLSNTESTDGDAHKSVEDASHLLQTEMADEEVSNAATTLPEDLSHLLQTEMTDEEVKLAAIHPPENDVDAPEVSVEVETPALESKAAHEESLTAPSEASGASQADEVETNSREFNFNDFSKATTTSEAVRGSDDESDYLVSPYLATALATAASGEKDIPLEAAERDATPLETSSSQPVPENEVAPNSYNLDQVAANLHDAAEKTLEDAKTSNCGEGQASVAESVAQIVLDESSKAADSSEYISGVVQHVAQMAQDAGGSDPNILPDTVARVFDGETASSPANDVSQPKGTTSLGTMVSLFVIWCVSLCASRISSKDMPAPALKLAAEEVAAVLHSNAPSQPAPVQESATSSIH